MEHLGEAIRGAPPEAASRAGNAGHFAATLPTPEWGRGLPLPVAAAYSGVPVRRLWALIAASVLPVVRVPGMRAVLLLRDDLDRLLEQHRASASGEPSPP